MLVQVSHPAPLVHVPLRARKERLSLVSMDSPAELREDDLSRSVEIGPLFPNKLAGAREVLHLLDGRLWTPVAVRDGTKSYREAPLDEFTGWLGGRADPHHEPLLIRQFAGTPLVAIGLDERPYSYVMDRGKTTRGVPFDPAGAREIKLDARDKARDDLARYLVEEIRILDGRPFVRAAPFLFVEGKTPWITTSVESRLWPAIPDMRMFPTMHETVDAGLALQVELGLTPQAEDSSSQRSRWKTLVPAGTLEGDDVRWILASFAEPLRRILDNAIAETLTNRDAARLVDARRAMRQVEIASMTGTAHHGGDTAVFAMREALAALQARSKDLPLGVGHLSAFVDRIVIPRLESRAAEDLDVESLLPA